VNLYLTEKENTVKELIEYIESSIKEGLDEFSFITKLEEMLIKHLKGKLK